MSEELRTIPPIMTRLPWNSLVGHALQKTANYTIRKTGSYYEAISGSNGFCAFGGAENAGGIDGTNFSSVTNAALSALTNGGAVKIMEGDMYADATLLPLEDTMIYGIGYGTKIRPTGDIDVIKVEINKYNVIIKDLEIRDDDGVMTSTACIRFANKTGHVWIPIVQNVRMVTPFMGIATDSSVDNNNYWVHTLTLSNIQVESPRSTALYLYNVIDPRVENLYASMSAVVTSGTPGIYVGSPNNVSVGGFFSKITLGNFAKVETVNANGIELYKVNETFWDFVICDYFNLNGILLKNSNRNRFKDTFCLSCGQNGIQIDGVHGGTTYDGSELNYFYRPVIETCKTGAHDQSSENYGSNFFHFPFFESNSLRYRLRNSGADPDTDIGNDILIFIPSDEPGRVVHNCHTRFENDMALANNHAFYFIDSSDGLSGSISMDSSNVLRIKNLVGTLHINPDATQKTIINYENTGNVEIGSVGGTSPVAFDVNASKGSYFRVNDSVLLSVTGSIDCYGVLDMHSQTLKDPYTIAGSSSGSSTKVLTVYLGTTPYYINMYPAYT